jgi:propane monooxygenase reductase subunit
MRGNVVQAIQREVSDAHRYDAYLCGAPPMCDAVSRLLLAKGVSAQAMFMDRFFTTQRDAENKEPA